jgi:hypothetical protein
MTNPLLRHDYKVFYLNGTYLGVLSLLEAMLITLFTRLALSDF